jgi:glycosyltransferase involved in cell wall biosynthesis
VLVIVQNMPVPLDRRVWLECQTLVDSGYRVSVICPKGPGDPARETVNGVRLYKYRGAPRARGLVGYGFEFAYCWLRTAILAVRLFFVDRFDAIQACNPPDTYWALARLFRRFGVRFVFDHHDLNPELYVSRRGRPSDRVLRVLEWLERQTYATADHVVTTNESYRARACERTGRQPDDVTVVRSGPDPQRMRRGDPRPELRSGRKHLVCYLGLMGPQDDVDTVVRVAHHVVHRLGRDDIAFSLLGYGDCLEDIRRLAVELEVADAVHFTGRVEIPAISDWLSTADLGITPDAKTPFADVSTMNKTLEYMAFGLPVLAFDLVETQSSAGAAAAYVTFEGRSDLDVAHMAEALVALVDDPARRAEMGRVGRARIENGHGWPTSARAYLAVYDRLLRGSSVDSDRVTADTSTVRAAALVGAGAQGAGNEL